MEAQEEGENLTGGVHWTWRICDGLCLYCLQSKRGFDDHDHWDDHENHATSGIWIGWRTILALELVSHHSSAARYPSSHSCPASHYSSGTSDAARYCEEEKGKLAIEFIVDGSIKFN
jgi:hypothetical protein